MTIMTETARMGTINKLAEGIERNLQRMHPRLRKTVTRKLALAVGAMLEGQTANTAELADLLPLTSERHDMCEQWLRRLLKNPLLIPMEIMAPVARVELAKGAQGGQSLLLSLDQVPLGHPIAVLMLRLWQGKRAFPLAWLAGTGDATTGREGQQRILEQIRTWMPEGASVLLVTNRIAPSVALFEWLQGQGWHYRIRLQGDELVDVGDGAPRTAGALATGVTERYLPGVRLFEGGISAHLGILHAPGHPAPWIIATDCVPTQALFQEYGVHGEDEVLAGEFKDRGCALEESHLAHADRLDRLILIMALAMYWSKESNRNGAA